MINKGLTVSDVVTIMEDRFKVSTSLVGDLKRYPIKRNDHDDFQTDRTKAKDFAEVFTPIYMVDEMLGVVPKLDSSTINLDLCSGHGQFTIRMLRKFLQNDSNFNIKRYLMHHHYFCELQLSSAWRLIWTFGSNINLAIGDALQLHRLPNKWRGIWLYVDNAEVWVNVTTLAKGMRPSFKGSKLYNYDESSEECFVRVIENVRIRLNQVSEGYMDELKQILSTPNGRRHFLEECGKAASGIEENWQDKMTPEWVCKEMVDCIPGGVTGLKKILVLFNAEFLEVLVKQKKVNPRNIDFAFDSRVEGLFAKKVYGVHTFSVGKNFKEMCEALEGKSGRYDIVISNPPYQINDGGGNGSSAFPVYHSIVEFAIDRLGPRYVCMITPSRWMAGGKGLKGYRARMLADRRMRMIQDFPKNYDVFQGANIPGGVSYFLWDRDYAGDCDFNGIPRKLDEFDILVRDNTAVSILKKVLKKHEGQPFCSGRVLSRNPFGLATNFREWVSESADNSVVCYAQKRKEKRVSSTCFIDPHVARMSWKVLGSAGTGHNGEIFTKDKDNVGYRNVFLGEKGTICLDTYLVLASFPTKKEALNYLKYSQTRFFQIMLSLRVSSQVLSRDKFSWVPDFQDYTVEYTDQDLYGHFGLTKHEIDHIEKTIKSLD